MNPYIDLLRPKNCVMASIATIIGFVLVSFNITTSFFLAIIVTFIICGAGQAINDVFDAKIDKKTKDKNKPIASGKISEKNALYYAIVLFIIGNILALFINQTAFIISIIISILLILYSALLYKKKYFGNFIIAIGTALPFIFGAASANNISALVVVFAISAFFANMARELTKDFEDIKKDKGFKITLPMLNEKLSHRLIIFYYFMSVGIAVGAFALYNLNYIYIGLIYLSTFIFLNGILHLRKKDFSKSQKNSKKGMITSLIAFIATIFR